MVLTDDEEAAIKAAVLGTSGINGDIDVHWILYCGTLVFLMQTGFAMLCARRRRHFTLHAAEPT